MEPDDDDLAFAWQDDDDLAQPLSIGDELLKPLFLPKGINRYFIFQVTSVNPRGLHVPIGVAKVDESDLGTVQTTSF